ncbi:MAG: helix-turn-helix domain-containing protein [Clostridia bacterium]
MNILKEFRENMKLTQSEFAKSIGISTSFYIKIELRR